MERIIGKVLDIFIQQGQSVNNQNENVHDSIDDGSDGIRIRFQTWFQGSSIQGSKHLCHSHWTILYFSIQIQCKKTKMVKFNFLLSSLSNNETGSKIVWFLK